MPTPPLRSRVPLVIERRFEPLTFRPPRRRRRPLHGRLLRHPAHAQPSTRLNYKTVTRHKHRYVFDFIISTESETENITTLPCGPHRLRKGAAHPPAGHLETARMKAGALPARHGRRPPRSPGREEQSRRPWSHRPHSPQKVTRPRVDDDDSEGASTAMEPDVDSNVAGIGASADGETGDAAAVERGSGEAAAVG